MYSFFLLFVPQRTLERNRNGDGLKIRFFAVTSPKKDFERGKIVEDSIDLLLVDHFKDGRLNTVNANSLKMFLKKLLSHII